ncbi:MAG: POT family MFS transporter [Myxococcales bacterium]|nr:POT family MFS transporter [Myxococcales bacterium]
MKGWPAGVKYIVGNEGAERFSYYGMRAILYVYLTILIQASGLSEAAADASATASYHLFVAGVYAFPVLGAILADKLLGKYHTIIWLSLVYCAGHAAMVIFDGNLEGTYLGLALIAVGAGGIKPCVSAHVGDQFGKSNWHLINKVFQVFYFIINFGSFFSTLLVPWLYNQGQGGEITIAGLGLGIEHSGMVAFGLPGVLMFIATFVFWMGRRDFVHVPANPGGKLGFLDTVVGFLLFVPLFMLLFAQDSGLITSTLWKVVPSVAAVVLGFAVFGYRQRIQEDDGFLAILVYAVRAFLKGKTHEVGTSGSDKADLDAPTSKHWLFGPAASKYGSQAAEGPLAVFRIVSVFFLVSVFWMLFDQHGSTWVEQASQMDRSLDLGFWTWEPLASQVSAVNPIMVMILIPVMTFGVFPFFENKLGIKLSPLRKMSAGMMMACTAFVAVALVQAKIETVGEGQVSVGWQMIPYALMTMSEVLVSITGLEFAYTQAPQRMKSIVMSFWLLCISFGNWLVVKLSHYFEGWALSKAFWIFAAMMFAAGVLFSIRAKFYTYKEYPQE